MQPTLLANTWAVAHLPNTRYIGLMCCAGSAGEMAFHNSLDDEYAEAGYQHSPQRRRRPPTYQVQELAPGKNKLSLFSFHYASLHTQPFYNIKILGNASTMGLRVDVSDTSLTGIDMSSMTTIKELPEFFLHDNRNLVSAKLPPNLEASGDTFMYRCTALVELDLSSLTNLKILSAHFMTDCDLLVSVRLPSNVEEIGKRFMDGCDSLVEIDLSSMKLLKVLPDEFMRHCASLASVKLPPNVEDIGWAFLADCPSLTTIDISALNRLKALPDEFMRDCINLVSVKLPPTINEIGWGFLANCYSLSHWNSLVSSLVDVKWHSTVLVYRTPCD